MLRHPDGMDQASGVGIESTAALHAAIDGFLTTLTSAHTQSAYRTDMGAFAAWHAQQGGGTVQLGVGSIELFRQHCRASGVGDATVARRMSAVKGFFRHAAAEGSVAVEPSADLPVTTASSPTTALQEGERTAVLATLAEHDLRTRLLVAMLLLDGLKLDEVLGMNTSDVNGRPPTTVTVKRDDADHALPLDPYTATVMAQHLRARRRGPLLLSERPARDDGRLGRFGADYLLKKVGRTAGLRSPLTANILRRTHAETAQRDGVAVDAIRRRMGHGDIRTTRRYLLDAARPDPKRPAAPARAGGRSRKTH
jgi:site-specific recombinase XerD